MLKGLYESATVENVNREHVTSRSVPSSSLPQD